MSTSGVATGVDAALRAAAAVLLDEPSALISDIDGTLSRIVARPEDATVDPELAAILDELANRLSLVAVVTGRDAATARRMLPAKRIAFVTHYGVTPDHEIVTDTRLDAARARARQLFADLPGLTFEEKGLSLALHYRNCADPDAVRARLLETLTPLVATAGGRLLEGKRVVEIVPAELPDKASAVAKITAESNLRGVVYLGDDVADVSVFHQLARRRTEQGLPGLAIAVVDRETDPAVSEGADVALEGVTAVAAFLARLPRALGDGRKSRDG